MTQGVYVKPLQSTKHRSQRYQRQPAERDNSYRQGILQPETWSNSRDYDLNTRLSQQSRDVEVERPSRLFGLGCTYGVKPSEFMGGDPSAQSVPLLHEKHRTYDTRDQYFRAGRDPDTGKGNGKRLDSPWEVCRRA